jgi:uncharacterized protein (TIGR02145 family)
MRMIRVIKIFTLFLSFMVFYSCKKDNSTISTVETYIPIYIASYSATIGCDVKSDGGSVLNDCGVYMGTSQNPEISGVQLKMGNDTGLVLGRISGLLPNRLYFVKAYAINDKGKALGEQINFTTLGTVSDFENNVYETAKIGNQVWMASNLKTAHYLNGDAIPTTSPATKDINAETSPKYQWAYDGNETNAATYGRLYTWYAVTDSRKVCPTGWHIPTDAEWAILTNYLGGESIAGGKLKESGTAHWTSPNTEATNETGFKALPAGYRYETSAFSQIGNFSNWWSSTEYGTGNAWDIGLAYNSKGVGRSNHAMDNGFSVRCIKD